ncbi:phage portal protein [Clostridium botulinum]|nr:phage portal protein [Clostridium botulinum]
MSFFFEEYRAEGNNADSTNLIKHLFTKANLSEVKVDESTVMNISSVASNINLIKGILSTLNFKLYRKLEKNKKEEIENDNRLFLLNNEPNYLMNSIQLKEAMIQDLLLNGSTYINISKKGNEIEQLYYVEYNNVNVRLDTEPIHKDAIISIRGKEYEVFDFIIATTNSKDGVKGKGIIQNNRDILALALVEQAYINKNLKAGGGRKGIWKNEGSKLGEDEFKQFKVDAKDIQETDAPIILNSKISYTPLTNTNKDMQLLEIKESMDKEIRSIFNIPDKLDEEKFKTLVKIVLNPIIVAITSAVNKALLLEGEKKEGYFFELDLSQLTKADIISRYNAYKVGLDSGITSINEVRAQENMENIDGLDLYRLSIGGAYYNSLNKTYFMPNMNATQDKDGKDVSKSEEAKENNSDFDTSSSDIQRKNNEYKKVDKDKN